MRTVVYGRYAPGSGFSIQSQFIRRHISFSSSSWLVVHSTVSSICFWLQRPVCFAPAPGLATRIKL